MTYYLCPFCFVDYKRASKLDQHLREITVAAQRPSPRARRISRTEQLANRERQEQAS